MATGTPRTPYRIGLVDNDALVLSLLVSFIGRDPSFRIQWTAQNGQDGIDAYRRGAAGINGLADIIVTDIAMIGMSGIEMCAAIRLEDDRTPLLGMTSYDPLQYERDAFDAGMQGVVVKEDVAGLLRRCAAVVDGTYGCLSDGTPFESPALAHERLRSRETPSMAVLSDHERQVMDLCADGLSTREVARIMGTSVSSVKTYIGRVMRKFDVDTRREAIALWSRMTGR